MSLLAINTALAVVWTALIGDFALADLAVGFALAWGALWVAQPLYGPTDYFRQGWAAVVLVWVYLVELALSASRVLWTVLTPRMRTQPALVVVPHALTTDLQVMVLANLITLTPGTLCLGVTQDGKALFVHSMFGGGGPEAVRARIRHTLERRVRAAFGV